MTDSDSDRSLTTSSTLTMVASPSNCIASPPPVALVPYPPKITDKMSRFMASHIILVSAAPEHPMRAPTVVRIGMSSIKPSAQRAQPL